MCADSRFVLWQQGQGERSGSAGILEKLRVEILHWNMAGLLDPLQKPPGPQKPRSLVYKQKQSQGGASRGPYWEDARLASDNVRPCDLLVPNCDITGTLVSVTCFNVST